MLGAAEKYTSKVQRVSLGVGSTKLMSSQGEDPVILPKGSANGVTAGSGPLGIVSSSYSKDTAHSRMPSIRVKAPTKL